MYARAVVRPSVERARRVRRIEAAALGMLAILPVVPYLTFLLRSGVPRFTLLGDLAIALHTTRHVAMGDVLVGEPSRFGFSQPGPLFFYLAAPLQALFAPAATGLYVAGALVNAAASACIVASARLFARRAHAIAALFVLLGWYVAFGSIVASPWTPFVVVLPLLAFLFNAAMLARGKSAAAYPAMLFGTLAAETHVAALPTVIAATVVAIAAFFVGLRRRARAKPVPGAPEPSTERWRVVLSAGLGFFLLIPPLVDQLLAPRGNLRAIASFFLHREAPLVRLGTAVQEWMTMMAWVPYRIARLSILRDGFVPPMEASGDLYVGTTSFPAIVASVHVGAGAAAALVAVKRRDAASLALLAIGALADAVAVPSLQCIVGPSAPYLVLWTTAATSILWIGVFSSFFAAVGAQLLKLPKLSGAAATPLVFVALAAAVTTASLQRFALARHPAGIGSHPELRADVKSAYEGLRGRLTRDGATPVIHAEGMTDIALAFYVELEQDRVDVRMPDRERRRMTALAGAEGAKNPLDLWFASAAAPGALVSCKDTVARSGDLVVLGACGLP